MNDLVEMHHIVLFPFMSSIRISHEKVFNETMCTQEYVYLFMFSIGFLQRDIRDIKHVDSVSPKLFHWIV
jgi:hypothetical protein